MHMYQQERPVNGMVPIVRLKLYDRIQLKKPHPCGGSVFQILRVGSDVRIVCQTCGRDMTMNRIKLEKAVKQIFPAENVQNAQEENKKGTEHTHE